MSGDDSLHVVPGSFAEQTLLAILRESRPMIGHPRPVDDISFQLGRAVARVTWDMVMVENLSPNSAWYIESTQGRSEIYRRVVKKWSEETNYEQCDFPLDRACVLEMFRAYGKCGDSDGRRSLLHKQLGLTAEEAILSVREARQLKRHVLEHHPHSYLGLIWPDAAELVAT